MLAALYIAAAASAPAGVPPKPKVLAGLDVLLTEKLDMIKGKRIGLITNPTGITADGRQNVDALAAAPGVKLVALFGPEHGVRGDAYAGDSVETTTDSKTGIPLYSLYGKNHKPKAEWMANLDMMLYDIQDTGNRSYTYIATMAHGMEAAKAAKIPFVVLDRPDPMGGDLVDGNILDASKGTSNVGLYPIAYLYGLTPGECAKLFNTEFKIGCDLQVVEMKGWKRSMLFSDTGLLWVPPSQHVPRFESSYHMGITGTIGELHTVNEGVGYTLPFETLGAPWIDADKFAAALNARNLPGLFFRPIHYSPRYGTYSGEKCHGVQIHIFDYHAVRPIEAGAHIMEVLQKMYPDKNPLGDSSDKKSASRINMFAKVMGTDQTRKDLLAGKTAVEIIASWRPEMEKFMALRKGFLLYP